MTYKQAVQIAIEMLDDAADYLTSVHDGFPTAKKQADELMSARNALHKALEEKREWVGLTREEQGDLRQAAEMALEALEEFCEMQTMLRPIERRDALRQALGQPEREWVGLTQEELQDLCVKSYHTDNAGETHFNRGYFADAIEAKLKEKNQ